MKGVKNFFDFKSDACSNISDGVTLGPATVQDALHIRWLYHRIHGGDYSFSLVYNAEECVRAIESDKYLWLLMKTDKGEVVGSVIFAVDKTIRLGKAFGGVVAEGFRGLDLSRKAIALGIEILIRKTGSVQSIYATTRTIGQAPQKITEKLGFKKLGIFPNVRKMDQPETHALAVYFAPGVLNKREVMPRLPLLLKPFFQIVRRETGLEEAQYLDIDITSDNVSSPSISFEAIQAPHFILRRFQELKSSGSLSLDFFPFHEPNLLLVSRNGSIEIYCYRSARDGHCVVTGILSSSLEMKHVLDSGARFLENLGTRYVELLIDGQRTEEMQQALSSGFLPSAYYPAMRWDCSTGLGKDYIVLSRSMAILDFKGLTLSSTYVDYLSEYFRLWRLLHIDKVFPK